MADKKFCGNGSSFGQYGSIKIGLKFSDLPKPNEKGWINLIVGQKKDKPGEYYVCHDEFVPTKREERDELPVTIVDPKDPLGVGEPPPVDDSDGLPF